MKKINLNIGRVLFFLFLSLNSLALSHAEDEGQSVVEANTRNYPGGRDEQDLLVQPQLIAPIALESRQAIEQKVLKSNFKKAESEKPTSANP